jgi:hypothetical protein
MTCSQGKKTCDASEIDAAISSQVLWWSEELRFSASGRPYECNASNNAQTKSFVGAISDPVWAGEQPPVPIILSITWVTGPMLTH